MGDRLDGKNILITAAANGIGLASSLAMANEGAKVFATDIDEKALKDIEAESVDNITTFFLDVQSDESALQGVERSKPDVLFNCAGYVHHGTILDSTDEEWDFAFDLNVRSAYRTIRTALPGMLERGKGTIINMSSNVSAITSAPDRFIYGTTKAAVIGLTKSVAKDYVTKGIRCNAVLPGNGQHAISSESVTCDR